MMELACEYGPIHTGAHSEMLRTCRVYRTVKQSTKQRSKLAIKESKAQLVNCIQIQVAASIKPRNNIVNVVSSSSSSSTTAIIIIIIIIIINSSSSNSISSNNNNNNNNNNKSSN